MSCRQAYEIPKLLWKKKRKKERRKERKKEKEVK